MRFSSVSVIIFGALCVALLGAIFVLAYYTMQQPPQFYQQAMQVPTAAHRRAGDQFEQKLIQLSNQMRLGDVWNMLLTEEEINGWIAVDLPDKFPDLLPATIVDPRISVSEKQLNLAFRVQSARFVGIVHITGDVFCTGKPNQIAVRLVHVGSGMFAIPIDFWAEQIQDALQQAGVVTTWSQLEGDPVALIDVPNQLTRKSDRQFSIDAIQVSAAGLQISGTTHSRERRSMVSQD